MWPVPHGNKLSLGGVIYFDTIKQEMLRSTKYIPTGLEIIAKSISAKYVVSVFNLRKLTTFYMHVFM